MADITPSNYQYIMAFYIRPHVLEVRMNRPEKRNAMSPRVWQEIGHVFSEISMSISFSNSTFFAKPVDVISFLSCLFQSIALLCI